MEQAKNTKKKIVVPQKSGMNLVVRKKVFDVKKMVIILVIVVAALLVFAKFGILDQLDKKRAAQQELEHQQQMLQAIQLKEIAYGDLEQRYGRYSYGWMEENEASMLQREKIFGVIEKILVPKCVIESLTLNGNQMSLSVRGITLDEARELVKVLEADENVAAATVYSAVATDEKLTARINMTVIFTKEAAQ
jgi:Tfp pilus assembly protein PilN